MAQSQWVVVLGASRSGHNWVAAMAESWGFAPARFENLEPSRYEEKVLRLHKQFRDFEKHPPTLFVVRSYLNWLASMAVLSWGRGYRNHGHARDFLSKHIVYWVNLFNEAFCYTNYIPRGITVFYDRFATDRDHREAICTTLGGTYNENRLNFVPGAGNGSSFDGLRLNGRGSEMTTCRRYRDVLETDAADLFLWALRGCPEELDLYRRHFELTPDEQTFLEEQQTIDAGGEGRRDENSGEV